MERIPTPEREGIETEDAFCLVTVSLTSTYILSTAFLSSRGSQFYTM